MLAADGDPPPPSFSGVSPVYVAGSAALEEALAELAANPELGTTSRRSINASRERAYLVGSRARAAPTGPRETLVSLDALDVVREHQALLKQNAGVSMVGLLRGSRLVFPTKPL